jgi:ubiquinol-cytochrome c reductase cytochrome c subunit
VTSSSVRRHKATGLAVLLVALVTTGLGYAAVTGTAQASAPVASASQIEEGKKLYLEGCATCHGLAGQGGTDGPTLVGVGAAAVDFQVSTGRMPLAAPGAQAPSKENVYPEEDIAAMAAYIATLAPGPAIPTAEQLDYSDADIALGGELFRINCAQCHQAAGQGGALTQGKYAPNLMSSSAKDIYQAMLTGPQNMPVFSDAQLPTEQKQEIIAYIKELQQAPNPGGLSLGRFGPVTETVFLFLAVFAALIAAAVWIGIKSR